MAVNQVGGSPVNSLNDDDHFGLADLGRIRDQYHTEPAAIRAARQRGEAAQKMIADIQQMEASSPGSSSLPTFQKLLLKSTRTVGSVNSRLSVYEESKQDRLNEQAMNMVGREFSPSAVNSYVTRNTNSLEAHVAGASLTGQGFAALDIQRRQIMNQMQGVRQSSMAAASQYIDQGGANPTSAAMLQSGSEQMKELAKQLIPITVAMQQLKQQGLDPRGRQEELGRIGNRAANVLHTNQLDEEMRSGKGLGSLSMSELKKKEAEAAEKLIKALSALNNAAGKTTDELNELNKNAEEAAKEFETFNEAKGRKGDSGGGSSKFEMIKMVAGTLMSALDMGAGAYQNATINQPMQMVANTTAAANMENEKYNSWHAALAGNMQERQNLNWTSASRFGSALANNEKHIHQMRQGAGLAGTIGGAAQMLEAGSKGFQGFVTGTQAFEAGAQGALNAASGFASGAIELTAEQRQTNMMATKIAGTQAFKGAQKAMTYVSGQQLQRYRDYMMGINETAGAMGGEVGEAFLERTGGADFLDSLSAAGIGTKEFAQLSLRGAGQMGSQFKESQIFSAVNLERKGYGTAEQNMQRIGMLSAAGQGDSASNLGRIIEDAMQRGLNSSKALDMIVENTAKTSEAAMLAGAAGDPSTGVATAILRAVDQSNPNKEQALKMSLQGFERSEAAQTNTAASLAGFMNVDRNMKALGVDRRSAQILTGLSTAEIEGMRGLSGDKFQEYLMRIGVKSTATDGATLAKALDQTGASAILAGQEGRGIAWGASNAYKALLDKNKDDKAKIRALVFGNNNALLSPEEQDIYRNEAAPFKVGGVNAVPQFARAAVKLGYLDEKITEKELKDLKLNMRTDATNEKRLVGSADSAQAAQGAALVGAEAKTAFAAIAQSGRDAFQQMVEKQWGEAAQKTAENFGTSAALMGEASGKLEKAAEAMGRNTLSMAQSATTLAGAVADAIAKIQAKLDTKKKMTPAEIKARDERLKNGPKPEEAEGAVRGREPG